MQSSIYGDKLRGLINKVESSPDSITMDELASNMEQLTNDVTYKNMTKEDLIRELYIREDDLQQIENMM